ncbi:MAG: hypothetical protein V1733_07705, partial [bacterium]
VSGDVAPGPGTPFLRRLAHSFRFRCGVCSVLRSLCESSLALLRLVSRNYYDPEASGLTSPLCHLVTGEISPGKTNFLRSITGESTW